MSKQRYRALGLVGAVALLAGCAAPSIKYVKVEEGVHEDVADVFVLNTFKLTVTTGKKADAKQAGAKGTDVNKAVPSQEGGNEETKKSDEVTFDIALAVVADESKRIGIVPTNNIWSSTKVNIAKVDNSERISSIGTDTTDNAKALVSTVGGLLVQIASLENGISKAKTEKCPYQDKEAPVSTEWSDTSKTKKEAFVTKWKTTDGSKCVELSYKALPAGVIAYEDLPKEKSEYYYYSACREVDVTLNPGTKEAFTKRFRIPDSNWLQKVAFPYKGSIAMHSVCGVSVTTTGQANPMAPYEFATEVLKQAAAIRKAGEGK